MAPDWFIYQGTGEPHDGISRLPEPPPWRIFHSIWKRPTPRNWQRYPSSHSDVVRATTYRPDERTVQQVNAALHLRRPILVTGAPGTGKTTLAYAVAHELQLGPVLRWSISSRSTLRDGLYGYDPMGRLYAASRQLSTADPQTERIGDHIRLGPLGTALVPSTAPRVLLIDEIDKSDIDLPNDLLDVFEEGGYEIPELVRAQDESTQLLDASGRETVQVNHGRVQCQDFPLVVMTSNGEREFPAPFLRRCIRVELSQPDASKLQTIVEAHLPAYAQSSGDLIENFLRRQSSGELATDQLLNAIYLTSITRARDRVTLAGDLMPYLSETTPPDDEY
jgi:MoxR-like ATPase